MKHIFSSVMICLSFIVNAQVGINTSTPAKMLDVNGTLSVRKEIRTAGSAGVSGQLFGVVNNGSTLGDSWKTVQIANGQGSLALYFLNTVKDDIGLGFTAGGYTGIYTLDSDQTTSTGTTTPNWVYVENAQDKFTVTKSDNKSKAILSFQTTVQISKPASSTWAGGIGSASYACGIFLQKQSTDGSPNPPFKLKAVRNDVLRGVSGSYKIYNLNITLDALAQGRYIVRAACSNRNLGSSTGSPPTVANLGIGRAVDTNTLNAAMSQTTLTTSLLESF